MTDPAAGADRPTLGPDDVYVYASGNGALFVLEGTGGSGLVPLATVLAVAERASGAGARVLVAQDDTPLADSALDALRARGVALVDVPDAPAPHVWPNGTDALMDAAATGDDVLLDDLVGRGADVHHRDVSGSTALHHAAAHGNVHAVEAIVAAGGDLEAVNVDAMTPLELARTTRQEAVAARLIELGASVDTVSAEPVVFARTSAWTLWVMALLPVPPVVIALVLLWPLSVIDVLVVVLVVAAYVWALPPRPFWAGGVPRRLDGDRLQLRSLLGRERTVDLADVTAGGIAGARGRRANTSRTILLAHPDGAPASPKQLQKMGVPKHEVDAFADRFERVIAVIPSGYHSDEAVLAVGNRLSALGVDLSTSFRDQLAAARHEARPPDT
jgi:hypothetical protein